MKTTDLLRNVMLTSFCVVARLVFNIQSLSTKGLKKFKTAARFGLFAVLLLLSTSLALEAQPTITSFSPTSGVVGTSVTISGSNFNTTAANNVVRFGAVKATVNVASANSLTVTVPVGATYQPISVTNLGTAKTAYSAAPFMLTYYSGATTYETKVDFGTNTSPNAVAAGDLNEDGRSDIAVANTLDNSVSVLRNTSTPGSIISTSFAAKSDLSVGSGPAGLAIADLDGDGKLDLAVANSYDSKIYVYRNTTSTVGGVITFSARVTLLTNSFPNGVIAVADFDGDGKPDLVVPNYAGSNISVFRNTSASAGTISFATKQDLATGNNPALVAVGDFDRDGKPDVAVTVMSTNVVSVFRNISTTPGTIAFDSSVSLPTGTDPRGIVVGDIDGDGKLDMALANYGTNNVSVFWNKITTPGAVFTTNSFAAKVDFSVGSNPRRLTIGDFNGDGKPDLAVTSESNDIFSFLRNTATAGEITNNSFAPKIDFATGDAPVGVVVGDFDCDGKTDITLVNNGSDNVSVFHNIIYKVAVYRSGDIFLAGYTTLQAAFAAINSGTHTGTLEIKINDNITETGTVVLNASGSGSANYTSVKVYPTAPGLSISGNLALPLINLNGADNVTIDGSLNGTGSTPDLTLINTNTGGSTIQFIADACTNTVQFCKIRGSRTSLTSGTILFSTGTTTGNDGNTIDRCNIYDGATTPYNAIYSAGTTTASSYYNSGNTISNNNIYNFSNLTGLDAGIYLSSGNTDWTISGNSLYQTATRTSTTAATDDGICIDGGSYLGNNFTVTGNFIGGSAPQCGGTPWTELGTTVSSSFDGIRLVVGSTTASNVNGNRIANITWNSNGGHFTGLSLAAGLINAGTSGAGNIIGSESGSTSIQIIPTTSSSTSYGIWISSSASVSIRYNKISSITVGSTSVRHNFYGICNEGTSLPLTIDQNTIGSTDGSSSITTAACTSTTPCSLIGITNSGASTSLAITNNYIANLNNASVPSSAYSAASILNGIASSAGTNTINGNTIYNLTTAANVTGTGTAASVIGINMTSTTAGSTLQQNTIYGLGNTHATAATAVTGIYYAGATTGTNLIARNLIYGLKLASSNSLSSMCGILFDDGLATIKNNMVRLGYDAIGVSLTTGYDINGLYISSTGGTGIYFNSVYIGGTGVNTAAGKSSSFYGELGAGYDLRNNIFVNARSNATTGGSHYAINQSNTSSLNYNDYLANGTGGVLGRYTSTPCITLAAWQSATSQDANSISADPQFIAPTAATPDLHIDASTPTFVEARGTAIGGVTDDFDGQTRASFTPTDIGADAGNFVAPPVEVWKSGAKQASYLTLQAAFNDINAGTHTGALDVKINGSTTETTTAVLNASGGTASFTSVKVYPTVTGLSVSGNLALPLIDLNGADNVTIDGSLNGVGSSPDLTIINTSTSTTAGTSTIRFIGDASNNTVKYCNLKGSEMDASSGVVYFSTATSTGNDNNTITNNTITCASDANRPLNAVYSLGTTGMENDNLVISNNNIYDFFNRSPTSFGVQFLTGTNSSTISGNSFYETASFVPIVGGAYNVVYVKNTSGSGFTVNGNFIGGQSAGCSGSPWTKTNAKDNNFFGIYIEVGNTTASEVQGNKIQNMAWSHPGSCYWTGITASGLVNVGTTAGNYIGNSTGTDSIVLTMSDASVSGYVYGIAIGSNVVCENNIIGAITGTNTTGTAGITFYGISCDGGIVRNNVIGSSSQANSINMTSAATTSGQALFGIAISGNAFTIDGNLIANLTNGSNDTSTNSLNYGISCYYTGTNTASVTNNTIRNFTSSSSSISSIYFRGTSTGNHIITGNTIYNLSNTAGTLSISLAGIQVQEASPAANVELSKNLIYGFSTVTSSSYFTGISSDSYGIYTHSNNIVNLSGNTATTIYGINLSGSGKLYFNTVYIGGSLASGTTNLSYALYSPASSGYTCDYRNNIFVNARTTASGSNLHYACYLNGTTTSTLTMDYNDYYVSGTGGGAIGYFNANSYSTLALFKGVTGKDINSLSVNPGFTTNPPSAVADYTPTNNLLVGVAGTGITTDFLNATRSTSSPAMGAIEIATTMPPVITYTSPQVYTYGTAITTLTPTNTGGAATSYSVSPALPAGLSLSTTTGDITGTPMAATALAVYRITATNAGGDGYYDLTITVNKAALTITGISISNKTYDGLTTATITGTAAYSGLQNGDTFAVTGTPTASFATATVGTAKAVTVTGYTAPSSNYTITQPTGLTADITTKALTVTGIGISNKTYDGLTTATITGTAAYSGLQNGETFAVTGTPTASFATATVGTAKAVTVAGYTAPSGNYTITQPTGLTADITTKALTITGISISNKTYDGLTTATITGTAAYSGLQNGETFAVTGTPTASFVTATVGTAKAVTVTGYTVPSSNYTITQPTGLTADITTAVLTYTATANSKTYGDVNPSFSGTVTGFIAPDTQGTATTGTLAFTTTATQYSAAGSYALTGSGLTANNGNYTFVQAAGNATAFTINKAVLTITAVGQPVTYGTPAATVTGAGTYTATGFVGSETVSVISGSATYTTTYTATTAAGTPGVTITPVLSGLSATNYSLTAASGTITITKKALTITADDKPVIYGTAASTVTSTETFTASGFANSETVSVISNTPTYTTTYTATTAAGTAGVTITPDVSGLTATNYSFTPVAGTITITKKTLTITANDQSVAYGTAASTVTGDGTYTATGFVNSETVSVIGGLASYTTTYTATTAAATLGITITPDVTALTATSYSFTPVNGTITIIAANSTITATGTTTFTYTGSAQGPASSTVTGSGGTVTYSYSGTGSTTYTASATPPTEAGTYQVVASVAAAANYNGASSVPLAFTINPATLTITGVTASDKTYNGTTVATLTGGTLVGVIGTDDVTIVTGTGTFADVNAGPGITVTASGYTLGGTKAGDYTLTAQPTPGTANITAAPLTITGVTAANKIYDGNVTATLSGGTLVGIFNSDDVTIVPGTGTFADAIAGTGKTVTATGYLLGGTKAGNYYLSAQPVGMTANIVNSAQTITFGALTNKTYLDLPFDLSATASSGLTVTYISSNTAVAQILGNTVTIVGAGSSIITASQAGDANYAAATDVSRTLTVDKAAQTIAFGALITKTYGDLPFDLSATASSGLAVTYTSSNTAVAQISGNTVTIVGAGSTTITASQAGNVNYAAATDVPQTLTVNKSAQTIAFGALADKTYLDMPFDLSATATSNLTVSFASSNTLVAQITGNTVTIVGAGSSTITASQAGDANYAAAANVPWTLTVDKATQTLTLNPLPIGSVSLISFMPTPIPVTASSSSSVLPVVISLGALSVATLNGSNELVSVGSTGIVIVNVDQAGDDNYYPAHKDHTFDVVKSNQSITFPAIADQIYTSGLTVSLGATASSSLPVSYTVVSGPATLSGTTLDISASGIVVVTASQAGDAGYNPATDVTRMFTVNKSDQTITFDPLTASTYGDTSFDLTATASSTLPVSYVSSNTSVATVSGITVTIVGVGSTTITAKQAGDANYNAAPDVPQNLTVNQKAQTITFNDLATMTYGNDPFGLTATASSGLLVTYTSSNTAVATVSGTTVTIVGAGNTTITAKQAGDVNYLAAADVPKMLTVNPATQTITFNVLSAVTYGDLPFDLAATASSTLPVSYVSSNTSVAQISGNTVTIVGAGSTTITASQGGNTNYSAATVATQELTVNPKILTITGITASDKTYNGNTTATLSTGTLNGIINSDDVTITVGTGAFATANVGTAKAVTATGYLLGGAKAGNYTLAAQPTPGTANITEASLSIIGVTASDKVYDTTSAATLTGGTLTGVIGLDVVTITPGTGTFANADVETGKIVTATGYSLGGANAGNYTLTAQPSGMTANITAASLSITGVTASNKTYDTNADATLAGGTLTGILNSDDVTIVPGTGTFANANVETGKVVTATGYSLGGTKAGNYTLATQPTPGTANITSATLTITGVTASNKVYDGNTTATLSVGSLTGILNSDDVTIVPGTGTFADANVGPGKIVTATGYSLGGTKAGNYTLLAQPGSLSADITKANQTITFASLGTKVFGDGPFTVSATGGASGNPVIFSSSDTGIATCSGTNGTTVTIENSGSCTIYANQAGNSNYNAATLAWQPLTISGTGIAPSNLSYSSPVVFVAGTPITAMHPSVTGTVTAYTVIPSLPTGLSIDTNTGIISGIPSTATPAADYTVKATNAGGSATFNINIEVQDTTDPTPAPANLSYSTPVVFTEGVLITPMLPTVSGTVTSFSASLPTGLAIDATTGIISGTPSVAAAATNYTVTATNTNGSTNFQISIEVQGATDPNPAPANLSYSTPIVFTEGVLITPMLPTVTGTVTSFSAALPTGLTINATTGIISGTPSVAAAATNYTVTATNANGYTSFQISIEIQSVTDPTPAPANLSYSTPVVFTEGVLITPMLPVVTGSVDTYSVSPILPTGLNINSGTGIVSGTPSVAAPATVYTVTATNTNGSTSFAISIGIQSVTDPTPAPANLSYSTPVVFTEGVLITPMLPVVTGSVTTYSAASLPVGLNINSGTGIISGTPSVAAPTTVYTVTATNTNGSTSFAISIEIQSVADPTPAPANLAYSTPVVFTEGVLITPMLPVVTGSVDTYSVNPILPIGLNINSGTGIISGTPSVAAAATNYTVTAINTNGSTSFAISIEIQSTTDPTPAPANLSYSTPVVFTEGVLITPMLPTVSGTVTSFSASLPTGLIINATTGIISGTPSVAAAATNYTVTATNANGSTNFAISIEIQSVTDPTPAPANLSYSTPVVFAEGVLITPMLPTVSGTVTSFSAALLPTGLAIDATTGIISGTPSVAAAATNYTVTATNTNGSTSFAISIEIQSVTDPTPAPANLSYSTPVVFTEGVLITPMLPTVSGTVTSFSASLPTGLIINATTGIISGTPSVAAAATNYTVTAINANGSTNFQISIEIQSTTDPNPAPANLSYSTPVVFTEGVLITPMLPTVTGTVTSFSAALPTGLNINATTGIISGTPSVAAPATVYTITATNANGSTSFAISIEIQSATDPTSAPANLAYSTPVVFTAGTPITPMLPVVTGSVTTFSAALLPTGLNINSGTGIISGTPSVAAAATNYTVTAINANGSTNFQISIEVQGATDPTPAPANLSYSTPVVFAEGVLITPMLPTVSGTVTSFSAASLPTGLAIDATTGIISGTPSVAAPATVYTVTATNTNGSTSFAISIEIQSVTDPTPAPANLSYSTPVVFTEGVLITPMLPTVTGTVTSFSAALPTGLAIDATTGIISGTPSVAAPATVYTVTGTNTNGSTSFQISIEIQSATDPTPAPANLSYSTPVVFTEGVLITPMLPTVSGTVTSFSAALPTGLAIDPLTGIISGTPSVAAAATNYTVTAINANGSTNFQISIEVQSATDPTPAPANLSYSTPVVFIVGVLITPMLPTVSGTVTSFSAALPTGLAIDSSTGIISGTPSVVAAATNYTVTATNTNGSTSFAISIEIQSVTDPTPAPANLSYSTPVVFTEGVLITPMLPTVTGSVDTFSAASLPTGLNIDSSTGIISGMPSVAAPATVYTVTATNTNGSTSFAISIEIQSVTDPTPAPANLSYSTPVVFTEGVLITPMLPTVTGTVTSFSAALPTGLNINATTGIISGTPSVAAAATNYTVTATNANGGTNFQISIEVQSTTDPTPAPANLSYSTPVVFTEGVLITPMLPTVIGSVDTYSVSPILPTGLNINSGTGIVSGTPSVAAPATVYTVTATNTNGSTSFAISIEIQSVTDPTPAPANLSYSTPVVFTEGVLITPMLPTVSGTVTSFSAALPTGLAIDATTGIISGTPSVAAPATVYTVTATNTNGSTNFQISIEIQSATDPTPAPANLSYSTPVVFIAGTPITAMLPSVTGTVTGYTVSPALPAGLAIDPLTGIISGTPSVAAPATVYTVTATNTNGSTSFAISIEVQGATDPTPAPANLSYSTPVVFIAGTPITSMLPSVTGTVTGYTVSPALPTGLAIDPLTGIISGTPSVVAAATVYMVTATNTNGSTSFAISIEIQSATDPTPAPANLSYSTPVVFIAGTPITAMLPSVTGTVTGYTVSPALPTGLAIDPLTGIISGTPTVAAAATNYTVTATNTNGSTNFQISIEVQSATDPTPAPANLSYSTPVVFIAGTPITAMLPSVTGTVTGYTVSPALSIGLAIDATTGIISGTPSVAAAATNYTVTATNTNGSTNFQISIEVQSTTDPNPAPANLSYSTPVVFTEGVLITPMLPTVSGTVTSFSASLPTGLAIDPLTGIISGTPSVAAAATNYTVTASNANGSTNFQISIEIQSATDPTPAPANLSYSTPVVFTEGVLITPMLPTVSGTVTSFSASLPTGLAIDPLTGIISGTPSVAAAATNYTVTATNGDGSTSFAISIEIQSTIDPTPAPANLSYSTPVVFAEGVLITPMLPTVTGTVTSFSASLPTGLNINATTGIISGTPSVAAPTTVYTVTATNTNGSTSFAISIEIQSATDPTPAPANLSYSTPVVFTAGTPITAMLPSVTGTVTGYTVSPALPTGLAIDATTGIISGTPSVAAAATNYTVTASNANGSTNFQISIEIQSATDPTPAPANLSYSTPVVFTEGVLISPMLPTVSGTVTSFSASLPTGLIINATTGIISGTPSVVTAASNYMVTATNTNGSINFQVNIEVQSPTDLTPDPANLSYSTPVIFNAGALIAPMLPTVIGTVTNYSVSPILPTGLSINATTGIISGTPSAVAVAANYMVTATNANGYTNFQINIEVQSATDPTPAPANLSYSTPVVFTEGVLITPMLPTVTGTVTGYAVSPALPAGLIINATTGAISGTPLSATAATNYMVTATNANGYTNFQVSITVDVALVGKRTQIIIFDLLPAKAYGDAPFVLDAISTSALDVSLASTNNAVAVVSGKTVTIVGVGTADIVATQLGNEDFYPAAEVVRTLVINKKAQTIVFDALPGKTFGGLPFTVSATGGASGNPVTFSSSDNSIAICSGTNGSTITIVGVGTCTISANQAGNGLYADGQAQQTLTVSKPEPGGVAPKDLSYSETTIVYTVGTTISPLNPTVGGGAVTAYSINPALPTGLFLDTTTGIISGTPETIAPAADYVVAATNAFGSATCKINIAVVEAVVPITISLKSQTASVEVCENSVGDLEYILLSGTPTQYKITFETAALTAGFKNVAYTNISTNGSITFNVIDGMPEGTYNATIQLRDASGTESVGYPFQFTVNLSSKYIIPKFDDVVLCDNSSNRFTAYQWYKNGVAIAGATKQFYCDPDGLVGVYSLEVTDKSGQKLKTCGMTLNIPVTKKVSIYPNPVNADQNCTAELIGFDLQELNGASLSIFNSAGSKVYSAEQVNQVNVFKLPFTPGIYIGHIITADKVDRVFKVIVR